MILFCRLKYKKWRLGPTARSPNRSGDCWVRLMGFQQAVVVNVEFKHGRMHGRLIWIVSEPVRCTPKAIACWCQPSGQRLKWCPWQVFRKSRVTVGGDGNNLAFVGHFRVECICFGVPGTLLRGVGDQESRRLYWCNNWFGWFGLKPARGAGNQFDLQGPSSPGLFWAGSGVNGYTSPQENYGFIGFVRRLQATLA